MRIATMGAALALAGAVAPLALAAATPLSPVEIKASFGTGKPFTANSTTGGASFTFVFKPDGTATQTSKGASASVVITGHSDMHEVVGDAEQAPASPLAT